MNVTHFLDQHGVVYGLYHHGESYDAQHMAQSLHTSHAAGRRVYGSWKAARARNAVRSGSGSMTA